MKLVTNQTHKAQEHADINNKILSKKPIHVNVASGTSFLKDSSRNLSGTKSSKLPVASETVRLDCFTIFKGINILRSKYIH